MDRPIAVELSAWLDALERRHLADLSFAEVRRAVQALNARYVRSRGEDGVDSAAVLDGAGKRAAFAYFYAPLHFLTVRRIVRELTAGVPSPDRLLDLGCGSGVGGAAWALETGDPRPRIAGVDRSAWAVSEARRTWNHFGLEGSARRGDLARSRLPGRGGAILAAWVVNELGGDERRQLRIRLSSAVARGARLLVVESIARRPVPWWDEWAKALLGPDGRQDTWRFPAKLPARLADLDRAAGLDHSELTARSLYVPGAPRRPAST